MNNHIKVVTITILDLIRGIVYLYFIIIGSSLFIAGYLDCKLIVIRNFNYVDYFIFAPRIQDNYNPNFIMVRPYFLMKTYNIV